MNRNSLLRSSSIALSLVLASAGLWGQSKWTVSASSPALSYQLTSNSEASASITVKKSSGGRKATSYYVVFKLLSLGSTAPGGGESLSYGLYKSSSSTSALSLTGSPSSSDQVLAGSFAAGSTSSTAGFSFRLSNSTFPAPGTYTATISATIYKGTFTGSLGSSSQGSATLTATVTVSKITSVAVVGGASDSYAFTSASSSPNYSLSFGSLSPGASGSAYVLALSNASYGLSLSSGNKGFLVNPADSSSMGYTVTVNSGSTYTLSAATAIVSGASATYSAPARYVLLFKVSSYGTNPSAGTYTDTITVTVSAM